MVSWNLVNAGSVNGLLPVLDQDIARTHADLLTINIKMSSYQYRKSHCGGKMVVRSSYLHNGISYTGNLSSLYWNGAQTFRDKFKWYFNQSAIIFIDENELKNVICKMAAI